MFAPSSEKWLQATLLAKNVSFAFSLNPASSQEPVKRLMRMLKENPIGACPIDSVKISDAKEWALRMREKGVAFSTIH